ASPVFKYSLKTPSKKSSAVGITNYSDKDGDWCMLVDYQYDDHWMYIWRAQAANILNGPDAWTLMQTYKGKAFNTGDQYQCFSLVTQTNTAGDAVYLLGFREDEEVWLWTLATSGTYGDPTYVGKYDKWNGSDFRNGTGLQI